MKKLLMAVAFASVTALSYGVALDWSMTGLANSPISSAKSGYFIEVNSMDAFNAAIDKYAYVDSVSSKESGKIDVGRTGTAATGTYGDYQPGDAIQGFVIVFDEGNANYVASGFNSFLSPAAGSPSLATDFKSSTGWQSTTSSVPEPTSGLLLLLGVAGMALKRKRA